MIIRIRPKYSEQKLVNIYEKPHNHSRWRDHITRVQSTIAFASWFKDIESVADLSAGDATIINSINAPIKYIGDFAPAYEFTGPIEETIDLIPKVDLFICSETLEHLDDPIAALKKIRAKTKYLLLTTPDGEDDIRNPEHYWGWDSGGIRGLLVDAGFSPVIYSSLKFFDEKWQYDYQFWGCE